MRSRWGTVACSTGDNRGQPGTEKLKKRQTFWDILYFPQSTNKKLEQTEKKEKKMACSPMSLTDTRV